MSVSSLKEIQELAKPLFEQFNLKQAAVFGSFARNEHTNQSDIDLIVDFRGTYDLLGYGSTETRTRGSVRSESRFAYFSIAFRRGI